jgi:hypothetical protein
MSFGAFMNKIDDYVYIRNMSYLVVGVDGFPGSSADITLGSLSRN